MDEPRRDEEIEPSSSIDVETPDRLWPTEPSGDGGAADHVEHDAGSVEDDGAAEDEGAAEDHDDLDADRGAEGHDGGGRRRRVRRTTKGRRSNLRRRRRRRSVARAIGYVLLTLATAALAIVVVEQLRDDEPELPDAGQPIAAEPEQDVQPTLVLATFDESDLTAGASLIVVAGHDRLRDSTTLLLVPTTTVADVPGHGLLPIGDAFAFGEGPLLDAALDNLLGVDFDHVVAVSEQGWSSLFTRVGGVTVDVPERLVVRDDDGSSQVRFRPGEQFLDGPRLAELMVFAQATETQLARLPRAQLVLTSLLEKLSAEPDLLDDVFADGAPMLDTTAPPEDVRGLFEQLVTAQAAGELVVRTLPVNPIGSGEEDTYRLDIERAETLIEERFSGSVPVGSGDEGRLLQILNGHGAPGIGGEVAQLLLPRGFRVVLTGNADNFDYDETRIVVYSDEPEQLAVAEEIKQVLGVGRIEFSRTPQSVVDITIVVGHDFTGGG